MTYSQGNPGYQPAQSPGSYGAFGKSGDNASKLPQTLQLMVAALGFAAYLASFGPMMTVSSSGPGRFGGHGGGIVALAVLAALLAGVGLLPKAKNYAPIVAVVAVLAALLAITRVATSSDVEAIHWGLWAVLGFTILQAVAAVGVLLLDAGVITAPVPKPKYDPYAQYGLPPGGGYYGQPGQPTGVRRGYQTGPQQHGYSSYGGYPSGPSTGGFGGPAAPSTGGFGAGTAPGEQQGPPTPPTGFPSFGTPSAGNSGSGGGQGQSSADPGPSGQGQQPQGGQGTHGSSAPSEPTQP